MSWDNLSLRVRRLEKRACCSKIYFYGSYDDFKDKKGRENVFYVDKDEGVIYTWDGSDYQEFTGSAVAFLDLLDTPGGYAGQQGKFVVVNQTEDGLEFSDLPGGLLEGEDNEDGTYTFTSIDGQDTFTIDLDISTPELAAFRLSPVESEIPTDYEYIESYWRPPFDIEIIKINTFVSVAPDGSDIETELLINSSKETESIIPDGEIESTYKSVSISVNSGDMITFKTPTNGVGTEYAGEGLSANIEFIRV